MEMLPAVAVAVALAFSAGFAVGFGVRARISARRRRAARRKFNQIAKPFIMQPPLDTSNRPKERPPSPLREAG
jgi:hypothetical protein